MQAISPGALRVLEQIGSVPVTSATDPPEHTRFRRALNAVWPATTSQLVAFQPWIDERVTSAVTTFAARARRTGDLVRDLAQPLASQVMGELMGVPHEYHADEYQADEYHARVIASASCLSDLVWGQLSDAEQEGAARALDELWTSCSVLVSQRHARPSQDITSALLAYRIAGKDQPELSPREIASIVAELLITNAELTSRLLANSLYHLLSTGSYARLRAQPQEIPHAVQETLRFDPPLIGWLRVTTRDTQIAGVSLPAGARLLLLLGSAARDEHHQVAAPDTFDPSRTDAPPLLIFGAGIHHCPGAPFALHLTQQAITALTTTCPRLALSDLAAAAPARWPTTIALRSPGNLTVTW